MTTIFVETSQFNQMRSYKPYATTTNEKKKVKYTLLDGIKEKLGDKWDRLKEGTRQAFDKSCFLSTELGFFFASDEYLANDNGVSDKTVRNRLSELVQLGQVVKVYRRAKKCNGRGKPIYLFTNHPYFKYWVELLGIDLANFHTDCQTEDDGTLCDSKDEGTKKVLTYYLPSKQESNIYKGDNTIIQYVVNRVNDAIKEGSTIKYISSYVDRAFRSLEQQALHAENNRQKAMRKKREEAARQFLNKSRTVPFYDWLNN